MKLAKHSLFKVLIISSLVIALTGCDAILGKLLPQAELDGPDKPSVAIADYGDGSATLHYGDSKTLTVTASVTDGGSLSYQWYKGTTNNTDKTSAISGEDKATFKYTAPDKEVEKTYYWCKVTNSKNGKTESAWTNAYDITVSNIITFGGDFIDENTTWESKYTYYIQNWVQVKASLTIPKGTVVKFKNGAYMETEGSGLIIVNGSVTDEKKEYVYFTSYLDHSVGITIPEFADSLATAGKGDWSGVSINAANASKIEYAVFRYSNVALTLNNEKANVVENCVFTDNKSNNNGGDPSAALLVNEAANGSKVRNNIFYNNDWPLRVSANYTVDTSNIFHNPEDENIKNVHQAIVVETGRTIAQGKTVNWKITELPYYVGCSGSHWVNVNGTLNIGDADNNVVVKFDAGGYINVDETGNFTLGTNSILTSWKDNEHGEDIWAGEDVGSVEWGDWEGIKIYGEYDNEINKDTTRVWYNNRENYGETNPTPTE